MTGSACSSCSIATEPGSGYLSTRPKASVASSPEINTANRAPYVARIAFPHPVFNQGERAVWRDAGEATIIAGPFR